ncbi:MAG: HEAT repeat domain-containing protein [Planctomycetota bacterium]
MINELTEAILLAQQDRSQVAKIATLAKSISAIEDSEVDELLDRLLDFADELEEVESTNGPSGRIPMDQLIQPIIDQLTHRETSRVNQDESNGHWTPQRLSNVEAMYLRCSETSDLRNHLLRWLATRQSETTLQLWVKLVCDQPPQHRMGIVLAFAPLMQSTFQPPLWLLDALLNRATAHSQIAPAVYDLFNFYFRNDMVDEHPASPRVEELANLLGQLAGQLGKIEEGDLPPNSNAASVNQLVSDSVALIVALCDTFAQLKHEPATGKLHQALGLRHRRVQTEAAAALTRLGDEQGKSTLIALAQQPIARLRVLAYAEELGFRDEISLELQGEIAIAESHLAIWLSEPAQMGLAPSNIEFMESREMYWPGYEHPVQCYLFRYEYGSGQQSHRNIAICGPMTHAFAADLQHLEPEDIYAAFAGWQTVHNEIFQVSIPRAEAAFANQWRRMLGDLNAQGFDSASPKTAASFFGQLILIAEATDGEREGTVIVDGHSVHWYDAGNPNAPIDWQLAYAIWRGHQMLSSFNNPEN